MFLNDATDKTEEIVDMDEQSRKDAEIEEPIIDDDTDDDDDDDEDAEEEPASDIIE